MSRAMEAVILLAEDIKKSRSVCPGFFIFKLKRECHHHPDHP